MEELIVSTNLDSAEVKLKENQAFGAQSVEKLKGQLIEIASVAYGSGATEGKSGGEGHIGLVGGRVVKFNTHRSEYKGNFAAAQNYDKMLASSRKLRGRLLELAAAVLQGKMLGWAEAVSEQDDSTVERMHKTVIEMSEDEKAKTGVLNRTRAAELVTFICREIKAFTGKDIEDEVWGAAKKFAKNTRNVENTRDLFAEELKAENDLVSVKCQKRKVGNDELTLVDEVIQAANKAGKDGPEVNGIEKVPPLRKFERIINGKTVYGFEDFVNAGYQVSRAKTVRQEDYFDALRYDRLFRVHNAVSAMIKVMTDRFGDCGLEKLFGYTESADPQNGVKPAESEFERRMTARLRKNVLIKGGGFEDFHGMSEKDYRHILKKLRDHFENVANRSDGVIAGDTPEKAAIRATARELCGRIANFLDQQIGESGMILTNSYMFYNNNLNGEAGAVASVNNENQAEKWKLSLQLRVNPQVGDGERAFWETDLRAEGLKGGAAIDVVPSVSSVLVNATYDLSYVSEQGVAEAGSLDLIDTGDFSDEVVKSVTEAVEEITNGCVKELMSKPPSAANTAAVREKFVRLMIMLRTPDDDGKTYIDNGNRQRKGLALKQDYLRQIFDTQVAGKLGFPAAPEQPEGDARAPQVQPDSLTIRKYAAGELGTPPGQGRFSLCGNADEFRCAVWDKLKEECQGLDFRSAFAKAVKLYSEHSYSLNLAAPAKKVVYLETLGKLETILRSFDPRGSKKDLYVRLQNCVMSELNGTALGQELDRALSVVVDLYRGADVLQAQEPVEVKTDYGLAELGQNREQWRDCFVIDRDNFMTSTVKTEALLDKIRAQCAGKDFRHAIAYVLNFISEAVPEVGNAKIDEKPAYLYLLRELRQVLETTPPDVTNAQTLRMKLRDIWTKAEVGDSVRNALYNGIGFVVGVYRDNVVLPAEGGPAANGAREAQAPRNEVPQDDSPAALKARGEKLVGDLLGVYGDYQSGTDELRYALVRQLKTSLAEIFGAASLDAHKNTIERVAERLAQKDLTRPFPDIPGGKDERRDDRIRELKAEITGFKASFNALNELLESFVKDAPEALKANLNATVEAIVKRQDEYACEKLEDCEIRYFGRMGDAGRRFVNVIGTLRDKAAVARAGTDQAHPIGVTYCTGVQEAGRGLEPLRVTTPSFAEISAHNVADLTNSILRTDPTARVCTQLFADGHDCACGIGLGWPTQEEDALSRTDPETLAYLLKEGLVEKYLFTPPFAGRPPHVRYRYTDKAVGRLSTVDGFVVNGKMTNGPTDLLFSSMPAFGRDWTTRDARGNADWLCRRIAMKNSARVAPENRARAQAFIEKLYARVDANRALLATEDAFKSAMMYLLFSGDTDSFNVFGENADHEVDRFLDFVGHNRHTRKPGLFSDSPLTKAKKNYENTVRLAVRAWIVGARDRGCTHFVGGPIGCGAFGNDSKLVSKIFAEEFLDYGGGMKYVFNNYNGTDAKAEEFKASFTKAAKKRGIRLAFPRKVDLCRRRG